MCTFTFRHSRRISCLRRVAKNSGFLSGFSPEIPLYEHRSCIGNTDDHLRHHAAFWNGSELSLTPAYDLSPQPRSTQAATHAIALTRAGERYSQLRVCRQAAPDFLLDHRAADSIIDQIVTTVRDGWQEACEQARLTSIQAALLLGREILNPYIFYDQP